MEKLKKSLKLSSLSLSDCKIGVSMPHYEYDPTENEIVQALQSVFQSMGYGDIEVRYAQNNSEAQYMDITYMIDEGCNVIILWAVDGNEIGTIMDEYPDTYFIALYDLIYNTGELNCFIEPDYKELGRMQGEYIRDTFDLDNATETFRIDMVMFDSDSDRAMYEGITEVLNGYLDNQIILEPPIYIESCILEIMQEKLQDTLFDRDVGSAILCCSDAVAEGVIEVLGRYDGDTSELRVITGCGGSSDALDRVSTGVQTMTIRIIDALAEAVFGWLDTNVSNINLFSDDETVDNGSGEIPVVRVTGEIIANYDYNRWPGYSPGIDPSQKQVQKIVIEKMPTKTEYYEYETFDPDGMVVRVYFTDGSDQKITDFNYTSVTLQAETKAVTISYEYGGKVVSAQVDISVESRTVQSIKASAGRAYFRYKDVLTKDDFIVNGYFDKGPVTQLKEFTFTPGRLDNLGNQVITFAALGQNTQLIIDVVRRLNSIEITEAPMKTVYMEGEYFDSYGMQVKAYYNDGTSSFVSDYTVKPMEILNGDDLTVSYTENGITATAKQAITFLAKKLERIEAAAPRRREYLEGEIFDPTGLKVTAFYDNGTQKRVNNYVITEEDKALTEQDTEITVTYTEEGVTKSDTVDITVLKKVLTGLRCVKFPHKRRYLLGDAFEPYGMGFMAQYSGRIYEELETLPEITPSRFTESGTVSVTFTYSENGVSVSSSIPVTVDQPGLYALNVGSQPRKRRYKAGETFDKTGMTVTAFFNDNPDLERKDVTASVGIDKVKLSAEDRFVTLSYTENGITKSDRVAVSVYEEGEDNSVDGQAELKYACGAGDARVNLFYGRLAFEHFDVGIGANSYTVGCSHIFNSLFDEKKALKYGDAHYKTHMGKGFRLSVQQYLIYDSEADRYRYFDGAGYRHSFVALGDGNRYYDTSGSDLLLKHDGNCELIYDTAGNQLYFENGVLVKTVSCYNQLTKRLVYNAAGRLTELYDERKAYNKIAFEYDEVTELLTAIKCTQSGSVKKTLTYDYISIDGDYYLSRITNGDEETVFGYGADGRLQYAADRGTGSCLKFDYLKGCIFGITEGTAEITEQNDGAFAFALPDGNVRQRNVIREEDENRFSVSVRNQKGTSENNEKDVVMMYYFNARGNTTAVLEADKGNKADLRSLEKLPGTEVKINPSSNGRGLNTRGIDSGFSDEIAICNPGDVSDYRKGKCSNYDHFTFGLWVKLDSVLKDPRLQVYVYSKNISKYYTTGEVILDNSAVNVWQYVTVPVYIEGDTVKEIKLILPGGEYDKISTADIRMFPSARMDWKVWLESSMGRDHGLLNTVYKIDWKSAVTGTTGGGTISETCYMSEKDLQSTLLSMYLERPEGEKLTAESNFILSLCDGTRKLWVSRAMLFSPQFSGYDFDPNITVNNVVPMFNRGFILSIKPIAASGEEPACGELSYCCDVVSPDALLTTRSSVTVYPSMAIGSFTGPVMRERTVATTSGKDPKSSEKNTYYDLTGRTLREIDEYGVTVTYEYDAYGSVSKKTVSHSDTTETLVFTAAHSSTETVSTSATSYERNVYSDPMGYLGAREFGGNGEAASGRLTETYTYDTFGNRLKTVKNQLGGGNYLDYDAAGRLSEVSPFAVAQNGYYGYRAAYDRYGNPCKFELLSGLGKAAQLLTEKTVDYGQGTITTKQYRVDEDHADITAVTLDRYGRTVSMEERSDTEPGIDKTTFQRQALWESAGATEVTEMIDPFENRTYTYSYDEYNRCTGYTGTAESGNFSVKKTGENTVTYFESPNSRHTETKYDESKLMAPRVESVNDLAGQFCVEWGETFDSDIGQMSYTYDSLGRIKGKKLRTMRSDDIAVENEYQTGTCLKNKIKVAFKGDYSREFTYRYDARGRITHENPASSSSSPTYTYDAADRLLSEKVVWGTNVSTKTYEYNADGSIKSEQTSGNAKIGYTYDKGRLVKRGEKTYAYDNIGNCTDFAGTALKWHRGTLLKQYGADAKYAYDSQGVRFRKQVGDVTTTYFHDGAKIIDELRGKTRIQYLYDAEEVIGFKAQSFYYYFVKDAQSNVRSVLQFSNVGHQPKEVARYDYDAWGNAMVTAVGDEKIDGISVAEFNPIRWKSQYYDTESGLYYINGRYYSPMTKQYLSGANVESTMLNAAAIYSLCLYSFTLTNPVNMGYNGYTSETNRPLVYDPPELNAWEKFWQSTLGEIIAGVLALAAIVLSAVTGQIEAVLITAAVTVGSLTIFAAIAGYQSSLRGKGFWRGFEQYICGEWAQEVAITALLVIVSIGISAIAAGTAKSGSTQAPANVSQETTNLKPYELDPRSIELAKQGDPSWSTFRKRVWQNEAKLRPELYGKDNVRLMSKGLAPIVNGKSMHLHHVIGKANDMYTVVKMTQPQHILFHKTFGYHVNAAWSWETLIKFMG